MNGSIYACLFSTGLIKVGRSIDPIGRMASHADRVSCAGIEIVKTHYSVCVGNVVLAERELINKCIDACNKRHKEEWFDGLCFDDVISWINELSVHQFVPNGNENKCMALDEYLNTHSSVASLGRAIGVTYAAIAQWRSGARPLPFTRCIDIEKATNGVVRCEGLRPDLIETWTYLRSTEKAA